VVRCNARPTPKGCWNVVVALLCCDRVCRQMLRAEAFDVADVFFLPKRTAVRTRNVQSPERELVSKSANEGEREGLDAATEHL